MHIGAFYTDGIFFFNFVNQECLVKKIFWKNLLKNKEMVFENGVKNIQAVAYNGAHTVIKTLAEI